MTTSAKDSHDKDTKGAIADLAARHGVTEDTVHRLLAALVSGHGTQAQFDIAELGGMGQWSLGGMTMVGDMFNSALAAKVNTLCTDIATLLQERPEVAARSPIRTPASGADARDRLFVTAGGGWPQDLGTPSSTGSQNGTHYAFYPETRRLAVEIGGLVTVYDTGDHRIGGVSQAQGAGDTLSFTSQHGRVRLSSLRIVPRPGAGDVRATDAEPSEVPQGSDAVAPQQPIEAAGPKEGASAPPEDDAMIFARIEKLAELHKKGILTNAEYQEKKADLLSRL